MAHELTHVPNRSWCRVCGQAKGIDDRHGKRAGPSEIDEAQADYQFLGKLAILTVVHVNSSSTFGVVGPKNVNPYIVQAELNILDCWGVQEFTLRTAQGPSVQALPSEVGTKRLNAPHLKCPNRRMEGPLKPKVSDSESRPQCP